MGTRRTFFVENSWVCSSCQEKNPGREIKCKKCGSQKEKDEKDILSGPTAPEVTDPELLKLAKQGAHWVCEYCGGKSRDSNGKCLNCAAAREAARKDQEAFQKDAKALAGDWQAVGDDMRRAAAKVIGEEKLPPSWKPPPNVVQRQPKYQKRFFTALISFSSLFLLTWCGFYFFGTKDQEVEVSNISWMYTVNLKQRTLRSGSDWAPVRGDAFNVHCETKFYGNKDCNPYDCRPHSVSYDCRCKSYDCRCRKDCTDQGNGFSKCEETCDTCRTCDTCTKTEYDTCYEQCPVYKDHCNYDWYEWPTVDTQVASGNTHETNWPTLAARPDDQRLEKVEKYEVIFRKGKESWKYSPKILGEFRFFVKGAKWRLKTNRAGMVKPLQAVK